MPEKPVADVSIIVPNFNNGRFLPEFMTSVINSTVDPLELIIVDDGSTDGSVAVLESYKNLPFLKIIRFNENRGLPVALNAGVDVAAGKYIMRADPDDLLLPERIEKQYGYMESHPETDVLGCNVHYFHYSTRQHLNDSNFPTDHAHILDLFRHGMNGIQHPTAFIRRSSLAEHRYPDHFPGEDYAFFATMVRCGCKFANLPEALYRMRIHPASSTSNLDLAAVRSIFAARDRIWNTQTPEPRIWFYFFYIYFYRKSQLATNKLMKYCFLFLAGIFFPVRIVKRLFKK